MLRLLFDGILKFRLHRGEIRFSLLQVLSCFAQDGLGLRSLRPEREVRHLVGRERAVDTEMDPSLASAWRSRSLSMWHAGVLGRL
jgi:hypothetical protein